MICDLCFVNIANLTFCLDRSLCCSTSAKFGGYNIQQMAQLVHIPTHHLSQTVREISAVALLTLWFYSTLAFRRTIGHLFMFQRTIWVKQRWSFLLYIWLAENNRLLVHIQPIVYAQLWAKHERKESVCVVFSLGHSSLFGGNYILAELLKWLKFPLTWLFLGRKIEDQSLHAMHVQCAVSFLLFLLVFWWCVRCGLDIWQLCVSVFK